VGTVQHVGMARKAGWATLTLTSTVRLRGLGHNGPAPHLGGDRSLSPGPATVVGSGLAFKGLFRKGAEHGWCLNGLATVGTDMSTGGGYDDC
jgi:hypothetical protein